MTILINYQQFYGSQVRRARRHEIAKTNYVGVSGVYTGAVWLFQSSGFWMDWNVIINRFLPGHQMVCAKEAETRSESGFEALWSSYSAFHETLVV